MTTASAETRLKAVRLELGWKKARVIALLRAAAGRRDLDLPSDESLRRMLAFWENGHRKVTEPMYQELFCEIYGRLPTDLGFVEIAPNGHDEVAAEVAERLVFSSIDADLVRLLEEQTQNYRLLDRRLGAVQLLTQTEGHVAQLDNLLKHALPGSLRDGVGVALTEAAALAGWQALDAGDLAKAWRMHETAKAAARDAENPIVLAHVTAQQAYVLLDAGKLTEAIALVQHARTQNTQTLPARLHAWLLAAEAEMLAAAGDGTGARRALDRAAAILPPGAGEPDLPYLMLDDANLARWRGHCLARLGADEAISDLTRALDGMSHLSSARAETGLRVDLALALTARGELAEARDQATLAAELASRTGSIRQRTRMEKLLPQGTLAAGENTQ